MGSPLPRILEIYLVLSFIWSSPTRIVEAQATEFAIGIDHVVGRYAFDSYNAHNKTGFIYEVRFPANLSELGADIVRYRCGSLKRYGAEIKEFNLSMGITVQPCVERVLIVRQDLGAYWSSIFYNSFNVSEYQLASHVLGLAAYDATNRSEVQVFAGKAPITIDFTNVQRINISSGVTKFLCASFDSRGRVCVLPQAGENICTTSKHGHFGLVTKILLLSETQSTRASRWKIIVGSVLGGALGALLLGLLLQAMCVKVKQKLEKVEKERREYELEALQISMVGHVRAPTASGTRTHPRLEHEIIPPV
ncbi:hypothetical protein ACHQM5_000939 [Ranunculus cassubicifolius]